MAATVYLILPSESTTDKACSPLSLLPFLLFVPISSSKCSYLPLATCEPLQGLHIYDLGCLLQVLSDHCSWRRNEQGPIIDLYDLQTPFVCICSYILVWLFNLFDFLSSDQYGCMNLLLSIFHELRPTYCFL